MLRVFLVLGLVGLSAAGVWLWYNFQSAPETTSPVIETADHPTDLPLVTFEPPEEIPSGGGVLGMPGIGPKELCDHYAANSCAPTEQPTPEYPSAHLTKDWCL